jgi:hypothetical protein
MAVDPATGDRRRASRRRDAPSPSLGRVVYDDIRQTRLPGTFARELKDLYHFYLDEESRAKLAGMGRIPRAFRLLGWLAKSLLMKLSPGRRLLLLISVVVMFFFGTTSFRLGDWQLGADLRPWGFLLLLIVLMLELKDKLVAKDEIQIARQVQLALLPNEHPRIPGWAVWSYSRPANDVGGDLVDYIELDGFRHGVVLGDVAGKGLGAALLTAKLQATLSALVPESASLEDLGSQVNSILFRDGLDNRFATLFYVEIEYHSGQARYLNAGHNPAFVIRDTGIERLGASSLPLGMMPKSQYEECALTLQPGEMLLVYSDGLTEAENQQGDEFGMQRLEALLPELRMLNPDDAGARLIREVDRFLGETRARDDLSIVIVLKR